MESRIGNRIDLNLEEIEILLSINKLEKASTNLQFLFLGSTYGNCYSELLQIITY